MRQGAPRFWTSKMVYIETACVCGHTEGEMEKEERGGADIWLGFWGALTPSFRQGAEFANNDPNKN